MGNPELYVQTPPLGLKTLQPQGVGFVGVAAPFEGIEF